MRANRTRELPSMEIMNAIYQKDAAPIANRLSSHYATIFYERSDDVNQYANAVLSHYKQYPSNNAMELNSVAWGFYERVEDRNQLRAAINWAEKSVKLDKQYMNLDTLAWLYKKAGMDKEAVKFAKQAIEMAKASGEDYSSTEEILNEE